jgi:hypothetical protein
MESVGENKTVPTAKLSAVEFNQVVKVVKKSAYDVPKSWRAELRFGRVELGAGPGIIVQGTSLLCGGTGNCQIWVFREGPNWVSLFSDDQVVLAEGFQFGPGLTHRIKDLVVITNLSADKTQRVTYKFDGRRYAIH